MVLDFVLTVHHAHAFITRSNTSRDGTRNSVGVGVVDWLLGSAGAKPWEVRGATVVFKSSTVVRPGPDEAEGKYFGAGARPYDNSTNSSRQRRAWQAPRPEQQPGANNSQSDQVAVSLYLDVSVGATAAVVMAQHLFSSAQLRTGGTAPITREDVRLRSVSVVLTAFYASRWPRTIIHFAHFLYGAVSTGSWTSRFELQALFRILCWRTRLAVCRQTILTIRVTWQ